MGRFLDCDFLVEEEPGMFLALDLVGEGVARVFELHFAGELYFHFDAQNGQRILVNLEFWFCAHWNDFRFYIIFE